MTTKSPIRRDPAVMLRLKTAVAEAGKPTLSVRPSRSTWASTAALRMVLICTRAVPPTLAPAPPAVRAPETYPATPPGRTISSPAPSLRVAPPAAMEIATPLSATTVSVRPPLVDWVKPSEPERVPRLPNWIGLPAATATCTRR